MTLNPKASAWLEGRGIDPEICALMQLYSGKRVSTGDDGSEVVPDPGGDLLVYPYMEGGSEVAAKYRGKPRDDGSKVFWQKADAKKTFWNADVLNDPALQQDGYPLVITEGEMDALSFLTVKHPFTVSVPNGAPAARDVHGKPLAPVPHDAEDVDPANDNAFSYLFENWDRLARVKRFILATDADEPGIRLRDELARRLGRVRCSFVNYPKGTKDANEVLTKYGPEAVLQLIDGAQPYPVKGIYRFSEFPDEGERPVYSTGWPSLDLPVANGHASVMLERGIFVTVLGMPEGGKSTWTTQLAYNLAHRHGWNIGIASPEMRPWRLRNLLRTCFLYKPKSEWQAAEVSQADAFLDNHFTVIYADSTNEEEEPTLEWLIQRADDAVIRNGLNVLIVDPWNDLEHRRDKNENVTEYTNRAIRALKRFARARDVLVIVVVHPTKEAGRGGPAEMSLYDAEGSSHWVNKPDIGLIIRRDYDTGAMVLCGKKFRFRQYGRRGEAFFRYNEILEIFE
jgi:twinkle protein